MLNVNEFKSKIIERGGILDVNRFKVILPRIEGSNLNGLDLNLFCISVDMPGRQITSQPRRIGIKEEKMADGFAVDDVNMSFYMPADGSVKKYFETWASKAVQNLQGEIGYKVDYEKGTRSTIGCTLVCSAIGTAKIPERYVANFRNRNISTNALGDGIIIGAVSELTSLFS